MSCDPRTVAACVFQRHEACAHDPRECPLVQVLARRVRNLGIEDEPAYVDRELDKYRAVARVLDCPLLAKVTGRDLRSRTIWPSGADRPVSAARSASVALP
jgi:hypothetical protein